MIKISKKLHFWNINYQLELYLNQITGHNSYNQVKRTLLLFLGIFFTILVVLSFCPLNEFQRHLLSDPCLFYNLPEKMNWIFMFFCTDNFLFYYNMYLPANKAMFLVREILYSKDITQTNAFFAHATVWKNGIVKTTLEVSRFYTKKYLLFNNYFVMFAISLASFYRIESFYKIFQNLSFFFTTVAGYLSLFVIFHTAIVLDVFVLSYGTIHITYCIIYICFTTICFLQFSQINSLLKGGNKIRSSKIQRFAKLHTEMLLLVFQFNHFFGRLLFAFILCHLPVNSYLLLRIIFRQFNLITSIIFFNFISLQFLALIGIKLLHW